MLIDVIRAVSIISNDVANDPRIKYHDWAKREKMQSFAGYPLLYKGQIIGVLAMFSERKLTPYSLKC
jgi:signal transduction protein with GAF and PtsI domain